MAELLRGTGVRLGLVTNGEHWMLVHALAGEASSYISWYASLWLDEPLTLRAFRSLLGVYRTFGVPDAEMLESLLAASAANQQEVTDQLGYQVRNAVEVLVHSLDRVDKDRGRMLLQDVSEAALYESALTVMMRLVFLFSAEERGLLLLGKPMYDEYYAVSTLRAQLRAAADENGEEVLERRYDAWSRLLATFRAVFGGVQHEDLRLPAYGGNLFDPDRFPFLEGRLAGTRWADTPARPLAVDNRTVLNLLEALQILRVSVRGGPAEPRRLSFRALDIEQIGHVYEGLLDHTAKRAAEPMLGLVGSKDREPELPLAQLERLAMNRKSSSVGHQLPLLDDAPATNGDGRHDEKLLAFLHEATGRTTNALANALAAPLEDRDRDTLRAACDNDNALFARVRPFAGLLRRDSFGRPVVITVGSVYVTGGTDRRTSGTHYTPRSLTEPIVQHTLDPLVYHGPAEGLPKEQWTLHTAERILSLQVCDMAMGSGAFLVQTCRYLAERLTEAAEKRNENSSPDAALNELFVLRDSEEQLAQARRLVADRCLYGVDKNPLAVEMAKLSLWLITLQKDRPFSFLDHAFRAGDSLLGISQIDQLLQWSLARETGPTTATFLTEPLRRSLQRALALRRKIRETTVRDVRDAERKSAWLREAEEALGLVKLAADLLIAAALHPNTKSRKQLSSEFQYRMALAADAWETTNANRTVHPDANREELDALRREADALLEGRRPFHWPLELPEVFIEEVQEAPETQHALHGFGAQMAPLFATLGSQPLTMDGLGFAAIVGNPPFQGGKKITGALGTPYRDYLVGLLANDVRGNADLCAYFFLRAGGMLRLNGQSGLIATNTIAQGDTREVGLDQLMRNGFVIPRAVPSRKWPGLAAVEVAHIWLRRGTWGGSFALDEQPVAAISPFLTVPGGSSGTPYRLKANESKSFQGSIVLGMGFVLEPEEAEALIAKDPRNKDVLFPYLNGEDLNSRPDQSPSRWVINFHDWPLERAETYRDCMAIVREKVKPERTRMDENGNYVLRKPLPHKWWIYADKRPELYATIAAMERTIVAVQTSKYLSISIQQTDIVFSHMTIVFAFNHYSKYAVMNSSLHDLWTQQHSSTLETRMRYIPTDCFETFPFPQSREDDARYPNSNILERTGEAYYEQRRQLMLDRQEGLTKIYNRFHNPTEASEDIGELRRLHVAMDQSVAAAYGWSDLDLDHSFHETKQGLRYTISEAARLTVLDRLLALNHQRYAEEVAQGLHDKGAAKAKARTKKATTVTPSSPNAPQLAFDLDEATSVTQPLKQVFEVLKPYEATTQPVFDVPPLDRCVIVVAKAIQRHQLHGFEKTLGHVKAEKILHLVEAHCEVDLGRTPIRMPAGPADFGYLLSVADRGKQLGAFQDVERKGDRKAYQFIPLSSLEQTVARIEEAFDEKTARIEELIERLVGLKSDEAEIVATLYAAWNDLLASGQRADEENLFNDFYGWDKSKWRFQRGELRIWRQCMEEWGIVPTGKAKQTIQRGSM